MSFIHDRFARKLLAGIKETTRKLKGVHQMNMWWGYLHSNGTLQLKRWFGDHKDYTEDCEGNDFVVNVVPPFHADSEEEAWEILNRRINHE